MISVGSCVFSSVSSESSHLCPFSGKKGRTEPVTGVTKQVRTWGCHQVTQGGWEWAVLGGIM